MNRSADGEHDGVISGQNGRGGRKSHQRRKKGRLTKVSEKRGELKTKQFANFFFFITRDSGSFGQERFVPLLGSRYHIEKKGQRHIVTVNHVSEYNTDEKLYRLIAIITNKWRISGFLFIRYYVPIIYINYRILLLILKNYNTYL